MEMQSLWKKVEIPSNFFTHIAMKFDNLFITVEFFTIFWAAWKVPARRSAAILNRRGNTGIGGSVAAARVRLERYILWKKQPTFCCYRTGFLYNSLVASYSYRVIRASPEGGRAPEGGKRPCGRWTIVGPEGKHATFGGFILQSINQRGNER